MKSKWNLIKYCELENGIKNKQIIKIQILNDYYLRSLDNQIRNGNNHVKTNYKADEQIITFYPSVKEAKSPHNCIKLAQSRFDILIIPNSLPTTVTPHW